MKLVRFLAKWFLISGCIGVLVGTLLVGTSYADMRYHFLERVPFVGMFYLLLAPGIIVGLGMPPLQIVLFDVCAVNFLLYGIVGTLISGIIYAIIPREHPGPDIMKK